MDQIQPTLLLHSASELEISQVQIHWACPKSMEIYEDYIPAQMITYVKKSCANMVQKCIKGKQVLTDIKTSVPAGRLYPFLSPL